MHEVGLTPDQLRAQLEAGSIETVICAFTDHYGRLVGKRFDGRFFVDEVLEGGTHACTYLLTVDMEMEAQEGFAFANWTQGYGDMHLRPDPATLRRVSWLDRTALVLCDVVDEETHQLVDVAPRSILRRQIGQLSALGLGARAASELEYHLYHTSYREAHERGYAELSGTGWYREDYHLLQGSRSEPFHAALRRHLGASGVPVECTKGEWGVSQHELNVRHAEVLEMADRHCLYKQCLREVADQMGLSVTFMAKPSTEGAGSSCHVHLSLWRDGENAFAAGASEPRGRVSTLFRRFLAGWMAYLPDMMVFYAPTVNSYKRYQSGSWAPTRIAWSRDNRTAAFRIVGAGPSLRIECRVPGADANPYLLYAAVLASGLAGVEEGLEPPDEVRGDVYHVEAPQLPGTLREALELFGTSSCARRAFGDSVVDHYTHLYRLEQEAFDRAVTDWERRRYFERI